MSVGLFLASLPLKAFCHVTSGTERCEPGAAILAMGWMEALAFADVSPFVILPWYANAFLVVTWASVLASWRKGAVAFGAVGTLLGLSFLLGHDIQISEGAGPSPITAHLAGYWVWVGSLVLGFVSAILTPRPERLIPSKAPGS